MNRPKGWPMCAGRATGIVFMIFLFVGLEWLGIYTSLFVNFVNRPDFFSGSIPYDIFIAVIFAYAVAIPINSGKLFGIYLFNFLYKFAFFVFYSTIAIAILLVFFDPHFEVADLSYFLAAPLIAIFFPYLRRLKRNCRWLDLNSRPEEWELPYLARDRARLNRQP